MSIHTSTQIAEKLSKVTKSMWPSVIELYVETILDEIEENIPTYPPDMGEYINKIKAQVNGDV